MSRIIRIKPMTPVTDAAKYCSRIVQCFAVDTMQSTIKYPSRIVI